MTEPQSSDGYKCSCGKIFPTRKEFNTHQLLAPRQEGGEHKSEGRVNLETGEITMPPWNQRSDEQKSQTVFAAKKEKPQKADAGKPKREPPEQKKPTEVLAGAMEIKFVPRVYTIDYSPVLRSAQEAAIRYWGWPPNMSLGDFLDTVIYLFFKEKGIILVGYIVDETEEERAAREAALKSFKETQKGEEVPKEEVPV